MGRIIGKTLVAIFVMALPIFLMNSVANANDVCFLAKNEAKCTECFEASANDPDAACVCSCKHLRDAGQKDRTFQISYPSCLEQICGQDPGGPPENNGGVTSKIGAGSVFHGRVYSYPGEAEADAQLFLQTQELTDQLTTVWRPYSSITSNVDSYLIHFLPIAVVDAIIAERLLTPSPDCTNPGGCRVLEGGKNCVQSIRQDTNLFVPGCQAGLGCKETPPSVWQQQGCGGFFGDNPNGCCEDPNGCLETNIFLGFDQDNIKGNGIYGTESAVCGVI